MNREKWLSALAGSILGLTMAFGSIGCLQSAFELPLSAPTVLWAITAGVTAAYSLMLQWKRGGFAACCLLALAAGYLYRDGAAAEQLLQLVQHLSTVYDRAYHWGVLQLTETTAPFTADLPLGIWAVLTALATVRCICCQKRVWLSILTALVPLSACVVVTDTVPRERYLFLLLTAILLLLLTDSVRRENRLQGIRLTLFAGLPVIAGLTALFLAFPRETYVNRSAVLRENIFTALEHMPQLMEDGLMNTAAAFRGRPSREIHLAQLGQRIPFTYPVMEVTAEKSGTLYLRGQDYDRYDGLGWTATEDREEEFFLSGPPEQTITIQSRSRQIQYLPYYPGEALILTGGSREHPKRQAEVTLSCVELPEDWRKTVYSSAPEAPGDHLQIYRALPEATRQGAEDYLAQAIRPGASNTEKADIIAALVTDCATYSLTPSAMPAGRPDFALWFLQQAEQGYCIHFATAAAVLLRAAEVPARYVTGYMVEAAAGETVTVTEEDAHAWAEYYEPRLGCWIPLEATPAEEAAPVPTVSPVLHTQPTQTATLPTQAEAPEPTEFPEPTAATVLPEPELPSESGKPGNQGLLLLLIPVLALILAFQRDLRLKLRRKRQHTGSTNAQALCRFREVERLARLLKETPAEELIELAQKAKYSQHEISAEELQHFDSYCRSCLHRLKEKPLHLRLIYRYLYAAY